MKQFQFQHPELIKCNPLNESINEDNEKSNESDDKPLEQQPQKITKPQLQPQQQYRILHPDLPTSSNLITSSNFTPIPTNITTNLINPNLPGNVSNPRIPSTIVQNVGPATTINQPIQQNSFLIGTTGPGASYRYRPTLGQKVLVDSALKRNRRHTLGKHLEFKINLASFFKNQFFISFLFVNFCPLALHK